MLEPFDVAPRIEALLHHFDDLNRAHEAVLKAKRQVALLSPLVADGEQHAVLVAKIEDLRACREALKAYFAGLKLGLLDKRLAGLAEDWRRQDAQLRRIDEQRLAQRAEEGEVKRSIAENGGDRLERLAADIHRLELERQARARKAQRYGELVGAIGEQAAPDEAGFLDQCQRFAALAEAARERDASLQNDLTELSVSMRQGRQEHDELAAEINSLKARRSNVPAAQVAMRSALCQALGFAEETMPFAGELLQVRDDERDWEGAGERLLHNFGLSLLIPDEDYTPVAEWVDRTHLRGRLVYFRVRKTRIKTTPGDLPSLHRDSLVRKLSIKPDSPHYDWLEGELGAALRPCACCADLDRFRRERKAVTRTGQVKGGEERHEKDDRHRLDDRTATCSGGAMPPRSAPSRSQCPRNSKRELAELGSRESARIMGEQNALQASA
jgi:uncharacterized protein YPO0396